MSPSDRLLFPPGASTAELSEAIQHPSHIKIRYFRLNINALTSRYLLACSNVSWESTFPDNKDWFKERPLMPFQCLPILEVTSHHHHKGKADTENPVEVVLAETTAIEFYLANLVGMMGDNEYEKYSIMALHSSSKAIQENFATYCAFNVPEAMPKAFQKYRDEYLPQWVEIQDKYLVRNGSNGHFIGDKLTLADIRTAVTINYFESQPDAKVWMGIISKSAALMKLKATVESYPPIAALRASDEYRQLAESTVGMFSTMSPWTQKL
ncbi:Glutathione S-transferase S1 [Actinomortierella ambigua]|nr:Glutathione S-transferase S1 [Actinomortierella ambigua]